MSTVARANTAPTSANLLKRRLIAGAIGLTIVAGVTELGKSAFNTLKRNDLISELTAAGPQAVAQYNDGKFAGENVVKVVATKGGQDYQEAVALTAPGQQTGDTLSVIEAEAGPSVDPGEALILPKDLVDSKYLPKGQ